MPDEDSCPDAADTGGALRALRGATIAVCGGTLMQRMIAALLGRARRRVSELARTPSPGAGAPECAAVPAPQGEFPVLGSRALIARTHTAPGIERLRLQLGFPVDVFAQTVRPLIDGYAEFVQLLPVAGSPRHAASGGRLTQALEVAARALDYRRGQILPRGAAPELIGACAHRWSCAVLIAALLWDADQITAGLRILTQFAGDEHQPWQPLHGAMAACGAESYRVEALPDAPAQDESCRELPLRLFHHIVPPEVIEWLAAEAALMRELIAFLSGEESARHGAIHDIVRRAASGLDVPILFAGASAPNRTPKSPGTPGEAQADVAAASVPTSSLSHDEPGELEEMEHGEDDPAPLTQPQATADSAPSPLAQSPPAPRPAPAESSAASASDAAHRFMGWLQQELAQGKLRINQSGAPLHVVTEGLLLASPRIFREYANNAAQGSGRGIATAVADDTVKSIQREFLRAGWHVRADNGADILTYEVRRGGRAVSRLSGVVIAHPERFVAALPPANALLVRTAARPRAG